MSYEIAEIVAGLNLPQKMISPKYFYDERGSRLFEQISELPEYYLTRTETGIMRENISEMVKEIGPHVSVIEFGSGSGLKTRILLENLVEPFVYVPVDISRTHLQQTANTLSAAYPQIEILPVCADFTQHFELPTTSREPTHAAVYFPGSTIGNFHPPVSAWTTDYYGALRERLPVIRAANTGDRDAQEVADMTEYEMSLMDRYSDWYGYEFFVGRKAA